MCSNRSNIGHQIFRTYWSLESLTKVDEQIGTDIRYTGIAISPEWKDAAAPPVIMVKVGDQSREGERWTS
jgi:hypothetical protein